ncbi:MAG: prolipoprotein diacylglyceryl transferase [Lachnospiraceae bacterium]|nr:prolipoprotein diacylglyceryl transferase [Lachnospiraceae bacterium]
MDIRFPNLNLVFPHVGTGIIVFGFEIKFYGMIIAFGFLAGLMIAQHEAKRTGQDPEIYLDYLLTMTIPSIIGARAYYVLFSWDYYKNHLDEIVLTRNGGMAIYGGVLAAIFVLFLFCKVRKYSPRLMADTAVMGLLAGQILGRWGNFFNREAFGGYTDGLFAMQIPVQYFFGDRISDLAASDVLDHLVTVGNQSYIQVHPTFLYEGLWNLGVLLFLLWFRKRKKWDGQMMAVYFIGYGIGRFWIEGLRTDSLYFMGTGIRASQLLALILVLIGVFLMIKNHKKKKI